MTAAGLRIQFVGRNLIVNKTKQKKKIDAKRKDTDYVKSNSLLSARSMSNKKCTFNSRVDSIIR